MPDANVTTPDHVSSQITFEIDPGYEEFRDQLDARFEAQFAAVFGEVE
jgi:hypothetical protein